LELFRSKEFLVRLASVRFFYQDWANEAISWISHGSFKVCLIMRREIDLHGLYAEQAGQILDREMQCAQSAGVTELVVIHGKGTGVLRETVMSTLFSHKNKWVDIIRGEDTNEIGDSGFVKVRMKYKEIQTKKYKPKKITKIIEKTDKSYVDKVDEKKQSGRQKYLKRMVKIRG